jgi:hypothetical protein
VDWLWQTWTLKVPSVAVARRAKVATVVLSGDDDDPQTLSALQAAPSGLFGGLIGSGSAGRRGRARAAPRVSESLLQRRWWLVGASASPTPYAIGRAV